MENQLPFVSVVIPVFNDHEGLKLCLEALQKQTYPKYYYEVIVVDNGSDTSIKSIVSQFDQAVAAYEGRPGSYVARNTGVTLAKGEVIAFTDADCIPADDWIEKGVATLSRDPNIGLVAGRINLFFKIPGRPSAIELYDSIVMGFPQDKFVEDGKFGVTANLFTCKSVLNKVGYFDETLKSGGDRQWGQRVFKDGYKLIYENDACVKHPTRSSWEELRKRSVRIVGGRYDSLKESNLSKWDLLKDLILFLKPPFRSLIKIWKNKNLVGLKQKLQFTLIMLRVRQASIQERLRLQLFGGSSNRV